MIFYDSNVLHYDQPCGCTNVTAQKKSFPLKIFSVNVAKSADSFCAVCTQEQANKITETLIVFIFSCFSLKQFLSTTISNGSSCFLRGGFDLLEVTLCVLY